MSIGEILAGAFVWGICIVVALRLGGFRFGVAETLCNCGFCQVPPRGDPPPPPSGSVLP